MSKILIGIGTYERPKMLQACLSSLIDLELPPEDEVFLLIADNSAENPTKYIYDEIRSKISINSDYLFEEKRGIVNMRNAILDYASKYEADYLVFLDDDEVVPNDWLIDLYQYMKQHDADVVSGMVTRKLPQNTPKWLIKGGFFEILNYSTGKRLNSTSTSNVIFDFKKLVNKWSLKFDERLNFFGTSDNLFFRQAYNKGAKILWYNGAIVEEIFPESRANEEWLLQRKFRKGVTQIKKENILHGKFWSYANGFLTMFVQSIKYVRVSLKQMIQKEDSKKREIKMNATLILRYLQGLKNGMFSSNPFEEYKQKHGF